MNDWLSGNIDEVTKQMLLGVIEKKQKWERLKTQVRALQIMTFLGFAAFLMYFVFYVVYPSEWMIASVITNFLSKVEHLYTLLFLFTLYWGILFYKKKCDKAENEFHALRREIIQKSADLWKEEYEWKERHKLFEVMKNKYDINLYYENS